MSKGDNMDQSLAEYRKLHLDAHFGGFQEVYRGFDAEACAQIFKEAGFQMVSFFAKCGGGFSTTTPPCSRPSQP